MNELIDKIIILTITLALYLSNVDDTYMIVPLLIVIIFSAFLSYLENNHIRLALFIAYTAICFFSPFFLFFIPLICYDIFMMPARKAWPLGLLPLVLSFAKTYSTIYFLVLAFFFIAYLLKYRTVTLQAIKKRYFELQYTSSEISRELEKKNKELIARQDYEINLATLNERNRIARDIHDNVGHLLTRSILQIGALLTIYKDNTIKEGLNSIKDTLSEALDSIRSSIHNLHEESLDLQTEIQKLITDFDFCPVQFDYDIDSNPEKSLKYCFIAIVKEALSNIMKHSDADKVDIILREHPGFYQLVIKDNGKNISPKIEANDNAQVFLMSQKGIGLKNITDRVTALDGNVNISTENGFRIFISVPKPVN